MEKPKHLENSVNINHIFFSCTQSTDRVPPAKFPKQILPEDIAARPDVFEFADWGFFVNVFILLTLSQEST